MPVPLLVTALLGCGATEAPPTGASGPHEAELRGAGHDRLGTGPEPPLEQRCALTPGDKRTCFVRVPGGSFLMGAQGSDPSAPGYDPEALPDEGPPRQVTVSPFWMMRYEVSESSWGHCVRSEACDPSDLAIGGFTPGDQPDGTRPLTGVSWDGAAAICAWYGGRLPTEAEWELAARGADGRRYPWGDDPGCGVLAVTAYAPDGDRLGQDGMLTANCASEGPRRYREVLGNSPYGLVGMAGSVWEWTGDWYAADAYAIGAATDPTGPATGTRRVQRGGGWTSAEAVELRSAARWALPPAAKVIDVGVRCVWGAR